MKRINISVCDFRLAWDSWKIMGSTLRAPELSTKCEFNFSLLGQKKRADFMVLKWFGKSLEVI